MKNRMKRLKRVLITMIVLTVFFGTSNLGVFAASTDVVNIPDAGLKANINAKLGVADKTADITEGQLAGITSLTLSPTYGVVANLEGLQYAVNLTSFSTAASYTSIETTFTDLSPIMNLPKLSTLQIHGPSKIQNFNQIASMTNLTNLQITKAPELTSVQGLSNLTKLKILAVSGASNINLSEINGMTGLTFLTINGTTNGNIDIAQSGLNLNNLVNLTSLTMTYTSIEDLSMIPSSTKIKSLIISNGVLADISGIEKLPNLTTVTFTSNKITSYEPLKALPLLEVINGSDNLVTDMEFINSLPKLMYAYVYNNKITAFPDLSGATQLLILDASNNQIEDISNVGTLSKTLDTLRLNSNRITDFRPASVFTSGFPALYQVNLLNQYYYMGTVERNKDVENVLFYDYDGSTMPFTSPNDVTSITGTFGQFEYDNGTFKWLEIGDKKYNWAIASNLDLNNLSGGKIYTSVNMYADVIAGSYTLSFDLNGGTGTAPEEQVVVAGSFATAVENPTRDGYDFAGWNTMADGSGEAWDFAATAMPEQDTMLYAQWTKSTVITPEEKPGTDGENTVKTGDESNLMAIWGMLVIAGAGLVIGRKKKNI